MIWELGCSTRRGSCRFLRAKVEPAIDPEPSLNLSRKICPLTRAKGAASPVTERARRVTSRAERNILTGARDWKHDDSKAIGSREAASDNQRAGAGSRLSILGLRRSEGSRTWGMGAQYPGRRGRNRRGRQQREFADAGGVGTSGHAVGARN